MKKIKYGGNWSMTKLIEELCEKSNEHSDWINLQEKRNDFVDALDDFKPKKLEVKHDEEEFPDIFCYTDKENEVIKKCLKYCLHRLNSVEMTGIDRALSNGEKDVFRNLIKKI